MITVGDYSFQGEAVTLSDLDSHVIMERELQVKGFTYGDYDQGLYVIGTDTGYLFFVTDAGDFGELILGRSPVKSIAVNGADITVVMGGEATPERAPKGDQQILLRRIQMGFNIPKGNYAISVSAKGDLTDSNPGDDTFGDGTVKVTMTGDITADGKVDGRDNALVSKYFGSLSGFPPNADINSDGKVDGKDIAVTSKYFGTIDP
jgi:hypothetical protein